MSADNQEEDGDRTHHRFSEEELEMMLFQWDQDAYPVQDYNYMKPEWLSGAAASQKKESLENEAKDTGYKTVVDLNKDAPADEEPVPMQLDTHSAVHIVEFYQPWCGHCRSSKPHYIDVAQQVTRRSIGIPVKFHGLSCQLYREVCRNYDVTGFPFIAGWKLGDNIAEHGIELNPPGRTITADSIASAMGLTLASERKDIWKKKSTDPELEKKTAQEQSAAAKSQRKERLEYDSNLNERYHNAAVSLAFVLKTGVFLEQSGEIDDKRGLALNEFLQLVSWATPQSWAVRTGMVEEVLSNMGEILTSGPRMLNSIVARHQATPLKVGVWGDVEHKRDTGDTMGLGVDVPHRKGPVSQDKQENLKSNSRWNEACHHNERGMGYTCGLWNLLHIVTIGAAKPEHRVYAFQSGYSTEPKQIAEVVKRFISNFLSCDVCRFNFLDMYENCGHRHCDRLLDIMPELSRERDAVKLQDSGRELALWVWEVHNSISVRLMKEAATRQNRKVTLDEKKSALFPTKHQCPTCWLDEGMKRYDRDEVYDFLDQWYWPARERTDCRFKATLTRHLKNNKVVVKAKESWESWWYVIGPVIWVIAFVYRSSLEGKSNARKKA